MSRVIIIVLDSVGIGALPDAAEYGDVGSNTLEHVIESEGINLPNLAKLGLGNIQGMKSIIPAIYPSGCYARMHEVSKGKDTTTGHWEIAGIKLDKPFPVFPNGFPDHLVNEIEIAIGRKTLGNYAASGTEIISKLGDQHIKTGCPIIYTSADSVIQIAAHESIISVDELYEMCKIIREIMKDEYAVGRVIARPFEGISGQFKRTSRRHDFSLDPIGKTVLDFAKKVGLKVVSVGKIYDIFNGKGITESYPVKGNVNCVNKTIELVKDGIDGILFTNLVDFDMNFGHRNDVKGYGESLKAFDSVLPSILNELKEDDLLIITADHGCDPTTPSTDHTREAVPLLVYGRNIKSGVDLGVRNTFADIAATVADYLRIEKPSIGLSFLNKII